MALLLGVSLTVGAFAPAQAGQSPTPVHFPANPDGLASPTKLPRGLDPVSGYFPQVSCDPIEMRGVRKLRKLVLATYGGGYGAITRSCVAGGGSEHKEGRAWDWMVDVHNKRERRAAGDFLSWLTQDNGRNARRLGVMYVIYNKRIWSAYRMREGWRSYGGYSPHTDHVHMSVSWAGARGNTSFWTGGVGVVDYGSCPVFAGQPGMIRETPKPRPCRRPARTVKVSKHPTLLLGSTDRKRVRLAQNSLEIAHSRVFDNATWRAVRNYQRSHDLPRTGALDDATWSSLRPHGMTKNMVKGYGPRRAARYGKRHYANMSLRRHSAGKAVLFLQTALRMPVSERNGVYRKRTVRAVSREQRSAGLRRDGKVRKSLWRELSRR